MNRRALLYGSAAAVAGLAGAGAAWWGRQMPITGGDAADAIAAENLWSLTFDTAEGEILPMSNFRGKPLLLNFWATWCPPCIEELPLLDSFYQQYHSKSWQVLGLAVDQPSAVRAWLKAKPLSFPIGIAGLNGSSLSKALGNLAGGLPFSVVLGASGHLLYRKMGKVLPEDLKLWAQLK